MKTVFATAAASLAVASLVWAASPPATGSSPTPPAAASAAPMAPASASAPSAASPAAGTLEEALVNLEKQSWEAWKNHDGTFFEHFLADDHVEVGFDGPTDKATVVRGVAGTACSVKSYAVERFQLTVFDAGTALLTYHAAQDTTCGGRPVPSPVWVGSLYVKRGGRWLNAAYQQSQTAR